jgi:exodeoxyribonuclease VII large subunit
MEDKYLSITAITRYIKHRIDNDNNLKNVYLKGEISNFKSHSSGHMYFSLKDENSIIKAIMFKSAAIKLDFEPKEGMKVLVTGAISVYEAGGTYQIYVSEMQEDGIGNLYIAFEKLKKKLSEEGLFDSKYKKKIPKYPARIGIVTAETGAAIRDILSTIERRYPICETYLFPCLVQGEYAAKDIIEKIQKADDYHLDVLLVGRGGGSFEDLNCFNDEGVARAIFACSTPVISAVGHEVDFTIADFVADLRAPTPTGAAEMAVPNILDLLNLMNQYKIRLNEGILKKVKYLELVMDGLKASFIIKTPNMLFEQKRQTLDLYEEKIKELFMKKMSDKKMILNQIKKNYLLNNPTVLFEKYKMTLTKEIEKLELLNPLATLKRGYSITYLENKVIKDIKDVKPNDVICTHITNGEITSKIMEVKENGKKEND